MREWGEFFPSSMSPFSYNETIAQEHFPLAREEALKRGYAWRDEKDDVPDVEIIETAASLFDEVVVAAMVAAYIGAAYWFTASTSFANPAAVLGRMFSDSFAGIAPASALGFVLAQCVGALLGVALAHTLTPQKVSV